MPDIVYNGLYQRDPAVVRRQIGSETVLVPVRSATESMHAIFALNETGAYLWNILEHPGSPGQLVEALVNEYDVTPEQAHQDVSVLLQQMLDVELIREVPDGTLP